VHALGSLAVLGSLGKSLDTTRSARARGLRGLTTSGGPTGAAVGITSGLSVSQPASQPVMGVEAMLEGLLAGCAWLRCGDPRELHCVND